MFWQFLHYELLGLQTDSAWICALHGFGHGVLTYLFHSCDAIPNARRYAQRKVLVQHFAI